MAEQGLTLVVEEAPGAETRGALAQAINAHHARTVPPDQRRIAWLLRDEAGAIAAGLIGVLSWRWLFVEALWVEEARRGQGLGARLLAQAEDAAREAGAIGAWLDTFQAAGFYRARGYEEFGALEDYPPGQARRFFRKRLAQ